MPILRRCLTFGLGEFSFVTGDGKVGDGGGELEYRFSVRLGLDGVEFDEILEEFEETDRLVFRRSRILITACIKRSSAGVDSCYCKSRQRLVPNTKMGAAMPSSGEGHVPGYVQTQEWSIFVTSS